MGHDHTIPGPSSAYDGFAPIYERYWAPHSLRKFAPILEQVLLPLLAPGAGVLDVCCGTGLLTRWLADKGFRVTGPDESEGMLRRARARAPGLEFVRADARDFTLPARYDAAISVFDSLNHMLAPEALAAAFRCVQAALAPGGVFFCDFNVRQKFLAGWKGDFSIAEMDHACMVRTSYEDRTRLARWEVTYFDHQGSWQRQDWVLTQRAYEDDEISRLLAEAGFVDILRWNAQHTPAGQLPLPAGKSFFLARTGTPRRPPA